MEQEIRCGRCNRLLARGTALALTIKCPRCGQYNHVRATSPDDEGRIVCLGCGEPVPPARLARVPAATRCTECQAEEDDLRRMGRA